MTFGVLKRNIYKECFTQYKYEKHNEINPNKIIDVERTAKISAWKMERDNGRLFGTSETRFNAGVCEMTELKTLKDLPHIFTGIVGELPNKYLHENDLKQEAIKWIKRHLRFNPELNEWTLFEHMGTDEWMKFFNITEEDLK